MKWYTCVLTKAGRKQARFHTDSSRLVLYGLSRADLLRVESLSIGCTYTDADGDIWRRVE